ncbi:MAG: tol-pal system protein YbgF [Alphaproteobacteria bacterium]|nr:tol-pal system protein YbgF [Alphaproteobacteria bacterium]
MQLFSKFCVATSLFGFSMMMSMMSMMPGVAQAQYVSSPTTQAARSAPTGLLTPQNSGADGLLEANGQERLEMLELKLLQIEQLLTAQSNLRARSQSNEVMKLRQRIEFLEAQGGARPAASATPPAKAFNAPLDGAAPQGAAELRMRFNDMAESLRTLQAHTDRLLLQMQALTQRVESGKADNEFRFQALESGVRRANAGISSTSSEPEVIGFVRRAAPVEGLETPVSTSASSSASASAAAPLVGEGDLSTLQNFGRQPRAPLKDPKALYNRALKDLQAGKYGGAEADFASLVEAYPSHKLAGNSQYWLGETFYVRRQYKQAAEAFLAGYTTYARSQKAPDSLLKLGMTLNALGEKKTGCDALAELGAKFPDASSSIRKRAQIERKRAGCGR